MQPRDPCPSYPVTGYTFNITERDTMNFTISITHTGNSSLVLNSSDGLLPNHNYILVIEVENNVGSRFSEEILFCKLSCICSVNHLVLYGYRE